MQKPEIEYTQKAAYALLCTVRNLGGNLEDAIISFEATMLKEDVAEVQAKLQQRWPSK